MDKDLFEEDRWDYYNDEDNKGKQRLNEETTKGQVAPIFKGRAKLVIETTKSSKRGDVAEEVMEARSEAFLACLEDGMNKVEAAEAVGVPLKELERDPVVQAMAKDLVRRYKFSAHERRELARAKVNQILLEGDDKNALAAVKLIAEDVEVGMTGRGGSVNVNVGVFNKDTSEVLARVPEIEGWEVIDVEAHKEDA